MAIGDRRGLYAVADAGGLLGSRETRNRTAGRYNLIVHKTVRKKCDAQLEESE